MHQTVLPFLSKSITKSIIKSITQPEQAHRKTAMMKVFSKLSAVVLGGVALDQNTLPLPTDYCSTVTYHTNLHRMNHSAPPVTYSQDLATTASKNIINCLANPAEIGGSNLALYWGTGTDPYTGAGDVLARAMHDWYEPEQIVYANASKEYTTTPDASSFLSWGHFSQMVWLDEQEIGCWSQYCGSYTAFAKSLGSPDWAWVIVCATKNAGNMNGAYSDNVKAPLNNAPSNYSLFSNNDC